MPYVQITSQERYMIAKLKRKGFSCAEIARCTERHPSTISREIRRNSAKLDGHYRAIKAIERTNGRRRRSRRNQQFTAEEITVVMELIKADFSPEQVSGRLKSEGI